MASKKETGIEMDDVLKAAKKFVKQGKLDELADAWVENKEQAENPNQLIDLLAGVGTFIKENDIEDKLEDFLTENTKSAAKKKTTTKKSTSSTKKKTTSAKKSTSSAKKTTKKKTSEKKTTAAKKTASKKKTTTAKKTSTKKKTDKK